MMFYSIIGLVGVCGSPLYGRIIDRITPWHVSIATTIGFVLTYALYWGAAGINIAVPVIVTLGLDIFRQSQQASLAARIFELEDGLRSRLNAVCMVAVSLVPLIARATLTRALADISRPSYWQRCGLRDIPQTRMAREWRTHDRFLCISACRALDARAPRTAICVVWLRRRA